MSRRITRRAFVGDVAALVGNLGLLCVPVKAYAQQAAAPRHIGVVLMSFSPESKVAHQFRQGLVDAGYAEGRDVVIEWRSANGEYDRLPKMIADLVQNKVDVIVVETTAATKIAKSATNTIPIVMVTVADPVGSSLVASLARPGGNVTGLSMMLIELSAKRLQLLKEAIPRVTRIAVLWNPVAPWHAEVLEDLKAAAPALSIELSFVSIRMADEIGPAFATINLAHAQALYVIEDGLFFTHRASLIKHASKARLPTSWGQRASADAGALMSYGPDLGALFRRSAVYVDKILKGAKPGDLPIEQPTTFELVVNLKTAKALGITIPQSILLRADEVIR